MTTVEEKETDFVPVMTKARKIEQISILSREIYPPEIAGLINWYVNNSPNRIDTILSEINSDAEKHGVRVESNSLGFLEAKKFRKENN